MVAQELIVDVWSYMFFTLKYLFVSRHFKMAQGFFGWLFSYFGPVAATVISRLGADGQYSSPATS